MRAVDQGAVAVRTAGGRVLLHLMKQTVAGMRTVCGRYPVERILPEDYELSPQTKMCTVCRTIADGTYHQGQTLPIHLR